MANITIQKEEITNICRQIHRVYEQATRQKITVNSNQMNYIGLQQVIQEQINSKISEKVLQKLLNSCGCESLNFRSETLEDLYLFFAGQSRDKYIQELKNVPVKFVNVEYQATKILTPDYENLQIDVEQEITRAIEIRKGELSYLANSISTGNLGQMKYENAYIKAFEVLEIPKDVTLTNIDKEKKIPEFYHTRQKLEWYFDFSRPLKIDEKFRYRIVLSYKNGHSFSFEDFEKARKDGFVAKKKRSEAHSLLNEIMQEMQTSRITLKLEKGYFIKDEELTIYHPETQWLPEKVRNLYTLNKKGDNEFEFYSNVYLPQSTYAIFWSPPTVAQLLEKKLITPEKAQQIYQRCK
ncbi:MAG: hypothetical protein EAZ44_07005 [Cytophagia bacterium]|nr:MAG: hypothetical protein EAZ44_07005 [Cytophagia bacterium]TAG42113.1 MAG: hypothetical protein EAZ31_06735 [Cytophagia bacterium]